MSNAVAVEPTTISNAYRMTAETTTGSYYLYTGTNDRNVEAIDTEKIIT